MAKKIVRNYLIFNFLFYFAHGFAFPTYVLFLKDNGLSMTEIGLVNFVFMVAMFIFEVPTGVVADFFGRKISIVVGVFIVGGAELAYFFSHSLIEFMLSEIIMAIGACFISGALDAWVKDTLDFNGYTGKIGAIYSKSEIVINLSVMASGALGAIVGNYSLRLPWLLSFVGTFLCGILSIWLLKEEYFKKKQLSWKESFCGMKKICGDSVSYGYKNKFVWGLIVCHTIFVLAAQPINLQWTLVMEKEIGLWIIPFAYIGFQSLSLVGTLVVLKLIDKKVDEIKILAVSQIFNGALIILAALSPWPYFMFGFFLLHEFSRSMNNPVQRALLQENIPSDMRATIGSFDSMIVKVGAGVGWMAAGMLADKMDFRGCWLISGIIFFCVIPLALRLRSKKG
ncbi:MAG: MFS transporter [Patescibacteria group bacterium]